MISHEIFGTCLCKILLITYLKFKCTRALYVLYGNPRGEPQKKQLLRMECLHFCYDFFVLPSLCPFPSISLEISLEIHA